MSKKKKYELEKIKEAQKACLHPEHKPPVHTALLQGTYKHTCPECGMVTKFEVPACSHLLDQKRNKYTRS